MCACLCVSVWNACVFIHVSTRMCLCVWVLVCMCGGEKSRGQLRMFSSLAPHFIFWGVISQCGVPSFSCTAAHQPPAPWPPVPAFLELDIQMCAACLHGHWGAKLRSVGLCGKMAGWAICPPPNFLFKGVRTWRWFFLFYFFFKFAFHPIYFDHVISTPNTLQVLQKPNKWWNLKQTNNNPVRQNHQSQTKSQSVFASGVVWSYKFYKQKMAWPDLSALVLKGGNEVCEELRPSGGSKQPSLQTLSLDLELLHLQNCEG